MMNLNDILSKRPRLQDELQELDRQDALADRARKERQTRREAIARELGYIAAVERMLSGLPEQPKEDSAAVFRQAANVERTPASAQRQGGYGYATETVKKTMRHHAGKIFSPADIRTEALRLTGMELKMPSIRSALRRMIRDGDVKRLGDGEYLWAKSELPLDKAEKDDETTSKASEAAGDAPAASE